MSFLDDTIIVEIHLKNKTIFKNIILENYFDIEQTGPDEGNLISFNLVKFITSPFPGFALYLRNFLGDENAEMPDIEEKYTGFIIANEVSFLRLLEASDLKEIDKTLLLIED